MKVLKLIIKVMVSIILFFSCFPFTIIEKAGEILTIAGEYVSLMVKLLKKMWNIESDSSYIIKNEYDKFAK